MATPSPPPRLTGNADDDTRAIINWCWDFYRALVLEEEYARAADLNDVVASTVDPAAATAATAQTTANSALVLATTNDQRLDRQMAGQFSVADASTTAVITLPAAQADTDYEVAFGGVTFTGAPAIDCFTVIGIAKTTTNFTVTIGAAPGVGNAVTLSWILLRTT